MGSQMHRRVVLAFGLASVSTAALRSLPASAQATYPERPIRLVVPRAAGGVVDVVARLWAERAKTQLGGIVIENQGGGGGTIAATAVARAVGDGCAVTDADCGAGAGRYGCSAASGTMMRRAASALMSVRPRWRG